MVVFVLLAGGAAPVAFPGEALAATPPRANYSFYANNDTNKMNTLGCSQAQRDQAVNANSMVILDFGGQSASGGTKMVDGTPVSDGTVRYVASWFAYGYTRCHPNGYGLVLGVGTNNSYVEDATRGTDWASLVAATNQDMTSYGYAPWVSVVAANDMEPLYSSAPAATSWMDAYNAYSGRRPVYNYGSADGCPPYGSCRNGWTPQTVYHVSWGAAAAYAFPEIYNAAMAAQWSYIDHSIGYIGFTGTLSQLLACVETHQACNGTNLGPDQSWGDLNADTGQSPAYSDDIGYSKLCC